MSQFSTHHCFSPVQNNKPLADCVLNVSQCAQPSSQLSGDEHVIKKKMFNRRWQNHKEVTDDTHKEATVLHIFNVSDSWYMNRQEAL